MESTSKAAIRERWDLPAIRAWANRVGGRLFYFGLPGSEILDLRCWGTLLRGASAVERIGSSSADREASAETIRRLEVNALVHLPFQVEILRGDIEDVILNGLDADSNRPSRASAGPAAAAAFSYDLVNLDFCGGLGYVVTSSKRVKRVRAIHKLIERQRDHSCLLIATLNIRSKLEGQIQDYLTQLRDTTGDTQVKRALEWFTELPTKGAEAQRLRAAFPLFVGRTAETFGMRCRMHPPIVYQGSSSSQLVHFVFELEAQEGRDLGAPQAVERWVLQPLLLVEEGQFRAHKDQPPGVEAAELTETEVES